MPNLFQPTALVGAIAIAMGFSATASAQDSVNASLDTLVVTATRSEEKIKDVPARISVISKSEIAKNPALNLNDLVKQDAALNVVQTGGLGQTTSIFTRGTNSNHTLVLKDGAALIEGINGKNNTELLDLSDISQIEILGRTLGRFTYMIDLILLNGFNMETLAGSRWPEWQNSLKVFYESPWIGSSINNFIPHNSYISGLIRFGLIGTIIMLFFIVMLAQRMKSTNLDNNTVFFLTASSGFTWGFLFVCIGGDYLFSTQVMLLLVTSLSIMQSSLRDSNSKTKK